MWREIWTKVKKYKFWGVGVLALLLFLNNAGSKGLLMIKNNRIAELEETIRKLSQQTYPTPTSAPYSPFKCSGPYSDDIVSEDKIFYAGFNNEAYSICIKESRELPGELYSRSQFGNKLVFAYSNRTGFANNKGLLFVLDTKKKTLEYYDASILENNDYNVFFGPRENQADRWSPDGNKIIITASNCGGCDPGELAQNYVFDLVTKKFTGLDVRVLDIGWENRNTIKWRINTYREATEEDSESDRENGVVLVPENYKYITVQ